MLNRAINRGHHCFYQNQRPQKKLVQRPKPSTKSSSLLSVVLSFPWNSYKASMITLDIHLCSVELPRISFSHTFLRSYSINDNQFLDLRNIYATQINTLLKFKILSRSQDVTNFFEILLKSRRINDETIALMLNYYASKRDLHGAKNLLARLHSLMIYPHHSAIISLIHLLLVCGQLRSAQNILKQYFPNDAVDKTTNLPEKVAIYMQLKKKDKLQTLWQLVQMESISSQESFLALILEQINFHPPGKDITEEQEWCISMYYFVMEQFLKLNQNPSARFLMALIRNSIIGVHFAQILMQMRVKPTTQLFNKVLLLSGPQINFSFAIYTTMIQLGLKVNHFTFSAMINVCARNQHNRALKLCCVLREYATYLDRQVSSPTGELFAVTSRPCYAIIRLALGILEQESPADLIYRNNEIWKWQAKICPKRQVIDINACIDDIRDWTESYRRVTHLSSRWDKLLKYYFGVNIIQWYALQKNQPS